MNTMLPFAMKFFARRVGWVVALVAGGLPAVPAHAGLTLDFELDHNGDGPYYLCFVELNTNAVTVNPPNTGYFAWSHSSSSSAGINAQVHPDGTSTFNGGGFPDYNALIAEFTNTWTLEVTNLTSTNLYTFYGTYFASNTLPLLTITHPTNGSTNIPPQPTFAWVGITNLGGPAVQLTGPIGFLQTSNLPDTQTNWLCPVRLSEADTYSLLVDYSTNADTTILATPPLDSRSQPISGWVSTSTLFDYESVSFTVSNGPPLSPIQLTSATLLPDGGFQVLFTNTPNKGFTALFTTDLTLPLSDWTVLGPVTESAPGQYQFTDLQAVDSPNRFYRVSSP